MKITTLIPVTRNDGSAVSQSELDGILRLFWSTFGALTVDGRTQGYWLDNGTLYQDECLKVVIAIDDHRLPEAEQIIHNVGRQLGQLAMYLEVDHAAEVRIIRI